MEFGGTINQGQYSFPFSFLLPSTMSGSFSQSDECYIRYTLKAILNHPIKPEDSQIYSMYLNIMEPPRMPLAPLTSSRTTNVKCCDCCKDYGQTTIHLQCDRNFAMNGDSLKVEVSIDHSRGKTEMERG